MNNMAEYDEVHPLENTYADRFLIHGDPSIATLFFPFDGVARDGSASVVGRRLNLQG